MLSEVLSPPLAKIIVAVGYYDLTPVIAFLLLPSASG
jgi:hypothetical protein